MRIAIVEDEIRIREGLARLIAKLDPQYEIVGQADNGKTGLDMLRQVQPEVIFADIKMPEMDGLEMLTRLYQSGGEAKAIVLSAYSEFEYAKRAIHLGVKEYLLKPLVVDDISDALRRVEKEIRQEREGRENILGSAEQVFEGILWGNIPVDDALREKLALNFQIPKDAVFDGICCYLGKKYAERKEAAVRKLHRILEEQSDLKYLLMEAEREQTLVVLIYLNPQHKNIKRWVQYRLLQDAEHSLKGALGFLAGRKLEELREGIDTLFKYMEWNITLGNDVIISYPEIRNMQTKPCIYPLEIENQMKLAVCTGEMDKIHKCINSFYQFFRQGAVYAPHEIKECYVRFLWAFMNVGKEIGVFEHEKLEQQKLLETIMSARTSEELFESVDLLESKLIESEDEVTHLTVKRAQSLIQEFYQSGITLEEIAARLNITPEYLGTVFHREMGMTFSAYMRNFRITKAKELLLGTSLKLYEIAEKVGYSDPKYFSKVFKEATGLLPADYRKAH